jgi:hypothetical protein
MPEISSGFIAEIANYLILSANILNFKTFSREFKQTIASIFVFSDFGLVLARNEITE